VGVVERTEQAPVTGQGRQPVRLQRGADGLRAGRLLDVGLFLFLEARGTGEGDDQDGQVRHQAHFSHMLSSSRAYRSTSTGSAVTRKFSSLYSAAPRVQL